MIVLPLSESGICLQVCPWFRNGDVDGSAEEVGKFVAASVVVKLQLGLVVAVAVVADVTFGTGKWSNFVVVVVAVAADAGNFAWLLFVDRLAVNSSFAVVD